MTDHIVAGNKKAPPCPVCRNVPTDYLDCVIGTDACKYCAGVHNDWGRHINHIWFVCLNELGVETVEQLKAKTKPDPRVAVLEKKLAKLTDKLEMVEQESEQRLSAAIGYSDQLLAMKEKYEPVPQSEPHPDGCFSSDPNDVTDCESDGHYSCKDCKRNSLIAAQRGKEQI